MQSSGPQTTPPTGVGVAYDVFFHSLNRSRQLTVKREPQDSPSRAPPATYIPPLYPTPPAPLHYPPTVPQASTSTAHVKPEPYEPFSLSDIPKSIPRSPVKTEVKAEVKHDVKPQIQPEPNRPLLPNATHKIYDSAEDIDYTPENALAEGVQMAKTIGSYLNQIDLGSQLRKDVWLREVER